MNMAEPANGISRRRLLGGAVALGASGVAAAAGWPDQPVHYPDPRIIALDPRFNGYRLGNTPVQRIWTGGLWLEGPAWNAVGRYLLWSDIPRNHQQRWLEDDDEVTVFRNPSNNSNGNTFDYQGRQISCEHLRAVVRYGHDGQRTVLAERYQGKRLNAPNDVVVHPNDGSIWFTDPGYGSMGNYEGEKGELELKEAVYRIDAQSGRLDLVSDEVDKPNGLCFSPDYSKLYVSDTGNTSDDPEPGSIVRFDVDGARLKNRRGFASMQLDGHGRGGADGIRADVDGNIWASAGWVGEGYDGVHVFAPDGQRIGQIVLPEICSNVCFGGARRNRLFMTASQSVYSVYVGTQGAHIS
jgi:gluconolactonase